MSYYPSDPIFLTQGEPLSLANPLYRTRVARILADADNQVAAVIQRQRLKVVTAIEQRVIDGYVTTYTLSANQASILARLRLSYTNAIERGYLATVLADLSILPFTADFSTLPNGPLPAAFTGATWTIVSGKAVNTPSLGSELAANGEFTSATTSWTAGNSATLTQRDSAVTPGTPSGGADNGCLEINNGGVSNGSATQTVPVTNNRWHRVQARMYSPSADTVVNAALMVTSNLAGPAFLDQASENAWQLLKLSARSTSTSVNIILRCEGSTSGDDAYYDSVSVRQMTLSELLNLIDSRVADVTISAGVTIPALSRMAAGVALNWDSLSSPANGVLFFVDRTNYYLHKLVAGTWSQVATGTITYSAGALVECIKNGTTYTMRYNGVQVGTQQTISDAGIINNVYHGMFDTDTESGINSFTLAA